MLGKLFVSYKSEKNAQLFDSKISNHFLKLFKKLKLLTEKSFGKFYYVLVLFD